MKNAIVRWAIATAMIAPVLWMADYFEFSRLVSFTAGGITYASWEALCDMAGLHGERTS